VTYRHNWGENRVYFHDERKRLVSLPAEWTSFAPADPFLVASRGRALFRFQDLLELSRLLEAIDRDYAHDVPDL
jgi:hypothetical protein